MRINNIKRTSYSPTNHPRNRTRKEEIWPYPAVAIWVCSSYAEAVETCAAEDELGYDLHVHVSSVLQISRHTLIFLSSKLVPKRSRTRFLERDLEEPKRVSGHNLPTPS
jgi:hypothetical protein